MNVFNSNSSRLVFLLAWLHAVVLERLRYVPVGWSKSFEFSESDRQCALDAIDEWVDSVAQVFQLSLNLKCEIINRNNSFNIKLLS